MTALAPCPFCGGKVHVERFAADKAWRVLCDSSGGMTDYVNEKDKYLTKADTIQAWNRRLVSSDDFTVMIFALRYAVGRFTYAPDLVCDYIRKRLAYLSQEQKDMLDRELADKIKYRECADEISENAVLRLQRALKEGMA